MSKPYVFPGVARYVDAAARELAVPVADVGRVHQSWHVVRVQDALGQLPSVVESARPDVLEYVVGLRDGLAAALRAVDCAIIDAAAGVGLPMPPTWPDPTAGQLADARAVIAELQAQVDALTAPAREPEPVPEAAPEPEPTPEAPEPDEQPQPDGPPARRVRNR